MAEPFTIYKMTILYMLDKAGFPLSNTQLSNFFLEKDYTDYFRIQEVNRETNTIGSKCSDAEIAGAVIEMKNTIEKIREQIQNIE